MKRIFSILILGHWLLFFVLHAFGALAGTLTFARLSALPLAWTGFEGAGPLRAMPLISAGMGLAALLAATLFLWALLASIVGTEDADSSRDVENFAFGGAALVFSMLSAVSIVQADPAALLAATVYFAALILSWSATRVEAPVAAARDIEGQEHPSVTLARTMASDAAFENQLVRISGREQA
jgi:hypothetical protein